MIIKEALNYINKAIRADPDQAGLLCARGEIYMLIGDKKAAREDFLKLKEKGGNLWKSEAEKRLNELK